MGCTALHCTQFNEERNNYKEDWFTINALNN